MKKYIETLAAGLIAGAVIMQLINMAVESLIDRQLHMGGEFLLPVLIGLVGYIGWNSADAYFKAVRHKEIYQKGFDAGARMPFRTGMMIKSGKLGTVIGSGVVEYTAPYAKDQYYNNKGKGTDGLNASHGAKGLRGAFFFERMKADHGDEIEKGAKEKFT